MEPRDGVGLDSTPAPSSTAEPKERMIGNLARLAVRLRKPLIGRLLPPPGKHAGERTDFDDPMLVNAVIHPLP